MRKIFLVMLTVILSTTLSECSFSSPIIEDKNPDNEDKEPEIIETNHGIDYIQYDNDLYDEFFDVDSIIEIKIDIEASELAAIQSDYEAYSSMGSKSPIYRMSDVTITVNGDEYFFEGVGIRMKGNTSRSSFYSTQEGIYEMIHFKLSFNQTFDDETTYTNPINWDDIEVRQARKDRLFAGMEKLDLKWNRIKDESYTREYWTYEMFRSFGVMAPNITPANLKINYNGVDENFGIIYALETIDDVFLEKRLAEKHLDGDLYKVGWDHQYGGNLTLDTLDRIGIEDEETSYFPVYDLKTNKKTSDHSLMKNLILKLNNENDPESLVNISYYIAFEAVSYFSGNPDDMRNHFNNYYIYFLKDTNLAVFIPYDYDRTFGINHDWDPTGNAMTSYSPYTHRTTMGEGNNQINPLILKTIARDSGKTDIIQKYRTLLLEISTSKFFDINAFYAVYDKHYTKYHMLTNYSLEHLSHNSISFNQIGSINMPVSEYMDKKINTLTQLIDSY